MKRIIVDYRSMHRSVEQLISHKYPNGFVDEDFIHLTNAKGERYDALELRTEDTIYMVKMCLKMRERLEDYELEEIEPPVEVEQSEPAVFDEEE